MAHRIDGTKLGRKHGPRMALYKNLAVAVLRYEQVKTTEARAKEVRALVDQIITWGKRGDVHARRLAMAELGDKELVHKVFSDIVLLELPDGELTAVSIDEFTVLRRA